MHTMQYTTGYVSARAERNVQLKHNRLSHSIAALLGETPSL
jgi:hypothetical protein